MEMAIRTCLGLNLKSHLAGALTGLLPENHVLHNRSTGFVLKFLESTDRPQSGILFVPASSWRALSPEDREALQSHQSWPFLLIADVCEGEVLEYMASGAFLGLVTLPLDEAKITRALTQAEEVSVMYQDIFMMAREISLERELLARKNEQLTFLNQLLTKASQTLDPAVILSSAADDLNLLLQVSAVMAVFWNGRQGQIEAELFLPDNLASERQDQWITHLLSVAKRLGRSEVSGYQVSFLAPRKEAQYMSPELEQILTQPLSVGDDPFGALVICSTEASTLGQDRLRVLGSAANHLALAMRNSLEFRKTKAQSDHDGLTRIANRQHFDMRLREEMKWHQRHQDELSLLMLDLDYFKSINDTYGHQAGDQVLREVGRILQKTLRESDFPARYGGEEFVIILPQTREDQAWMLAERLRAIISQSIFQFQQKMFRVTVSIGIAGLKPGALAPPEELIHIADQALYRAKTSGRNMVCSSSILDAASMQ